MSKPRETTAIPHTDDISGVFVPSRQQIDAFARRLMPEIKKFFADEQVQQEFVRWQENQKTAE